MNKYIEKIAFNMSAVERAAAKKGVSLNDLANMAEDKSDSLAGKYYQALRKHDYVEAGEANLSSIKSNNRASLLRNRHYSKNSPLYEEYSKPMKAFLSAPKDTYAKHSMPLGFIKEHFPEEH